MKRQGRRHKQLWRRRRKKNARGAMEERSQTSPGARPPWARVPGPAWALPLPPRVPGPSRWSCCHRLRVPGPAQPAACLDRVPGPWAPGCLASHLQPLGATPGARAWNPRVPEPPTAGP